MMSSSLGISETDEQILVAKFEMIEDTGLDIEDGNKLEGLKIKFNPEEEKSKRRKA